MICYVGVRYLGKNDLSCVALSLISSGQAGKYPDHGGDKTYDFWKAITQCYNPTDLIKIRYKNFLINVITRSRNKHYVALRG